jgi:hypothetical protein
MNQYLLRYGRVNIWVDNLCDQFSRPIVLPNRLTGAVYHRFLVNNLPVLLEHVPLHQWQHMMEPDFSEQLLGRGGPINWLARFPDLNSLDSWLWGHLKGFGEFRADQWLSPVVHWNRICPSKWSPVYGPPGRPIFNLVHCSRITSDTVPKTKWSL